MSNFLQFGISGLTVGAVYALIALGFSLIYNASDVVNFAQGEFVMIGGMVTVFLATAGIPVPLAALMAVAVAIVVGVTLHRLAIEPLRGATSVTLIIITIGASIFLRGAAEVLFDKQPHGIPPFSGEKPIVFFGSAIQPQSLWVIAGTAVVLVGLYMFFERSIVGKAILATAANRSAAQLVGINTSSMVMLAFGASAAIGALAGVLITPITLTSYDVGTQLALKGFAAAMLGGMGSPLGAVVGGVLLGLIEAFTAGYVSSVYKDAVAFIVILATISLMPQGLLGKRSVERV
jgi:branched-chain amino acid transport system permease protein